MIIYFKGYFECYKEKQNINMTEIERSIGNTDFAKRDKILKKINNDRNSNEIYCKLKMK